MDYIWANLPKICCNFYAFGQVEIYTIFFCIKNLFYMQIEQRRWNWRHFRNKSERGWDFEKNLKNVILCVETAFVRYNYMFLTTPYKILPFSKL